MKTRLIAITILSCCACCGPIWAQSEASAAKAKLSKWVETRQIISEEKADWLVDEAFLKSTREMLEEQVKSLESEISELSEKSTEADEKRRDLLLERGELQRSSTDMAEQIAGLETQIKSLVQRFPEPLKNKLDPLIVRIPANPSETTMPLGQRLINVLGILGQAEKFNSTANFYGETRQVGGQKIQVLTLYWGLSFALYVDSQGKISGFGRPGQDGWVWTEDNSIAPQAKRFMDMYEGNTDTIEFIDLPIKIQ